MAFLGGQDAGGWNKDPEDMSQDKFEARLNRINASVQPKGASQGGGSGSWRNGQGVTGQEPRLGRTRPEEFLDIDPPRASGWEAIRQQLTRLLGR